MSIKDIIITKYGSINQFVSQNQTRLGRLKSRTHIYRLIQGKDINPTLETMTELAKILEIPLEEVVNEYSTRHRIDRTTD